MSGNTPVALLIFNRPQSTRLVFEAVSKARPPKLLVVADGPRNDRIAERDLCLEARAVIDRVDWPCEVLTQYSDVNMGCKSRILSGLDWVFSKVDAAIILEDDCLPHPSFFPFCEEMLARYRDDERVYMVRGGNFLNGRRVASSSYYFSRWYHIWGWATWARAWRHNDPEMKAWPAMRDSGWLERTLPSKLMVERAREIMDENYAGRLDTWEYYWVFSAWARNGLAVCPVPNLVTNIGFGEDATHLRDRNHPHSELGLGRMDFPLRHPPAVRVNERADLTEWELLNPKLLRRTLLGRIRNRWHRAMDARVGRR